MRGKYSPTVSAAYHADNNWWRKFAQSKASSTDEYHHYDPDGYDSYGYDINDRDRAGNFEYEYYETDPVSDDNELYEQALLTWKFNGVKPVNY
jgi:hypothetical protein